MAFSDDFYEDDPEGAYRKRVMDELPGDTGIAGGGSFPAPAADPLTTTAAVPKGGYNLEGIRSRLGFGKVDLRDPDAWLKANQDVAMGTTIKKGKMYDASGKFLADVISNMSSGGTKSQFLDGIGSNGLPRTTAKPVAKAVAPVAAAKPTMASAVSSTAAQAAPAAAAAAPVAAPVANTSPQTSTFLDDIRKLIMDRMGGLKGTPSINDPELAAQSGAYRRSQQRNDSDERAQLAERAAANGTLMGGQSSGGFDTALQGIAEQSGENQAAFDAGLVGDETQYRRAEVQNLMDMALASGDSESARELSKLLADMDLDYRNKALKQSGSQFDRGLAQDKSQFNADLGYRNRALDQSGQQFNANLGQQRYMYDDGMGYDMSRSAEDDYRWRVLQGLG